jgi:hypothetical protein
LEVVLVETRVTTAVQQDTGGPDSSKLDVGTKDEDVLAPAWPVTKHDAACVVVAETGCTLNEARNMIDWVEDFVLRSRRTDYSVLYPRTRQMSGRNYEIFDAIMPHGMAPTPGTAADAVNKALLDMTRGETYILHDQTQRFDAVYCSVTVQTLAVQLN